LGFARPRDRPILLAFRANLTAVPVRGGYHGKLDYEVALPAG
jgi:hypothetical protein